MNGTDHVEQSVVRIFGALSCEMGLRQTSLSKCIARRGGASAHTVRASINAVHKILGFFDTLPLVRI